MSKATPARRPELDEAAEFYWTYIRLVPAGDVIEIARDQVPQLQALLANVSEAEAMRLHPPYTWTIKQVTGHLIDTERVFAGRLHRFACGDLQPLPSMQHDSYVANSDYLTPPLTDLLAELLHCRQANSLLLKRIDPSAWDNRGIASGSEVTVRALAFMMVGHICYHAQIISQRLGLDPKRDLPHDPS